MKFIRLLSTLQLFCFVSWVIVIVGSLYIFFIEPFDSVMALGLIPFWLTAIGSTPLIVIAWLISRYKRHKSKYTN